MMNDEKRDAMIDRKMQALFGHGRNEAEGVFDVMVEVYELGVKKFRTEVLTQADVLRKMVSDRPCHSLECIRASSVTTPAKLELVIKDLEKLVRR